MKGVMQCQKILRQFIYALPLVYFLLFLFGSFIFLAIYDEHKGYWEWIFILFHTLFLPFDFLFLWRIQFFAQTRIKEYTWPFACCGVILWIPKLFIFCLISILLISDAMNPSFDFIFQCFIITHGLQMIITFLVTIPLFAMYLYWDCEDRLVTDYSEKNLTNIEDSPPPPHRVSAPTTLN